ncbi:hypothetical protein C8Q77DRAFT_244620 [Trametes polyzona]|nr:hypothetical protein C8Q77DRAFT_244620 [Trametes polyzona]
MTITITQRAPSEGVPSARTAGRTVNPTSDLRAEADDDPPVSSTQAAPVPACGAHLGGSTRAPASRPVRTCVRTSLYAHIRTPALGTHAGLSILGRPRTPRLARSPLRVFARSLALGARSAYWSGEI